QTILSKDENDNYRWFADGEMNTCYLAVDRHVENGRGDQAAIIYDSPVTGTKTTITFKDLLEKVSKVAGGLKALGVEKGDRVLIYMPMVPEVVFAMLACARLGAIHSVVFGGFAANELAIRIDDAKPKVILTASGGKEIDKIIPYKPIVNNALDASQHQPDFVVLLQRSFVEAEMKPGRDLDWHQVFDNADPEHCVPVKATDPLYILYTSGTTGKPKGIVRDNGGHAVALRFSMQYVYGVEPGSVYWAASDVGWVVGHSYIVYGPLINGNTTILFEGKPVRTPDAGTFWRVIEEHNVSVLFTAPTAIRAIKKEDPNGSLVNDYDTSSLKYLFLAGERCDVATLNWSEEILKVPVIDHWWQTESGWPMLANLAGVELLPVKPGSAGKPVCGYNIQILDHEGNQLPPNTEGAVAIKLPLAPGTLPTLWENDQNFKDSYLSTFPGYYFSGDGGFKDDDGYFFITGRIDDIINVAGHRLSTAKMEEVVASHPAVAECAVIGIEDKLKGQIPVGFVVLKSGVMKEDAEIEKELIQMVRDQVGPVAAFKRAIVTKRLPKTRSGKILRKVMRGIADGADVKTPSTIEDMSVLGEISTLMHDQHVGIAFNDEK
ncbi:MAG: acetate--CoA ligase, partial [Saprospiraceae bacterium]|nr:acetate--CoA ligase [Saprospiraceae bacterium]